MFGDNNFVNIFAIDMGIQWVAWGVASYFQTEKFYDLTGKYFFVNFVKKLLYYITSRLCNLYCFILSEPKMEQRDHQTTHSNKHGDDMGGSPWNVFVHKNS